jgi:hypothetical protein
MLCPVLQTTMKRIVALTCAALAAATSAAAQSAAGAQLLSGMGAYSHPIQTRSAEAQKYFDQGLAMLYNFNHGEAERSFLSCTTSPSRGPGRSARRWARCC